MLKKLKFALYLSGAILITLGLSISLQSLLAAWTAPAAVAPGGNVYLPINEGSAIQTKLGGLGIGGNFTVMGTAGAAITLWTNLTGTSQKILHIGNTGTGVNDGYFQLSDNGTVKVNIAANNSRGGDTYFNGGGNVGIGTTDPKAKLSFGNLNDGRDTADGITWYNPSPTAYGIYRTAGAWTPNTYQQLKMQFDTGIQLGAGTGVGTGYDKSYVEVVSGKGLMVTSGNVGIGTTNPGSYHLSIKGTNGFSDGINAEGGTVGIRGYAQNYGVIGSYTSGTGYNGVLGQSFNSPWKSVQGAGVVGLGSSYGVYGYGANTGYDIVAGNSSGKSYFAGKVGIGMTDPGAYTLNVNGNINASGNVFSNGSRLITSPACTLCLVGCGGSWPWYQGHFSTDDDGAKNSEAARSSSCTGNFTSGPVGGRVYLCCQ